MSEPNSALALKNWLSKNGGAFHPDAVFAEDGSGFRIIASKDIPADAHIVSCPVDLVITPELSMRAICDILAISESSLTEKTAGWAERQWIATYLSLHWVLEKDERLNHIAYLKTLPSSDKLHTPLHFTVPELELFRGSNIFGATADRRNDWQKEWQECRSVVAVMNTSWAERFTWEYYLTAATYISSRAFPSSILSTTPTLVSSDSTYPILVPGVDSLNHARGHAVSWLLDNSSEGQSSSNRTHRTVTLVHHPPTSAGQELFNNYGPKPNAELILGYGFSLPNNPDDTIVLKLGGIQGQKWEVGRNARNAEGLWNEILSAFVESEAGEPTYEDILDASGQLREMVEMLLQRLPEDEVLESIGARPEVLIMRQHYLEGQRSILQALLDFAEDRVKDAICIAKEQGIELVLEDD